MVAARQFESLSRVLFTRLILLGLCGPLAAAPYSGGSGTSQAPYLLSTPTDVVTLLNTSADWDKWFVLTTDLDLRSTPVTTPIGTKFSPFTGVFDGAGHAIRGLTINDTAVTSNPWGLFGIVGSPGVIERLRFIAPTVKMAGNGSVGVLAGQVADGVMVQQCSVEQGSVLTPASDAAGGLIGDNGGTVRECCATGTISALGLAGGLLGRSTGTVENCSATATITTTKVGTGTAGGGLAGASVGGTFRFCLADSPSVTSARPAGLVGYADPNTVFSNCVCNRVAPKAVENWPADALGFAWCEDPANLKVAAFFTGLGWDLQKVWSMDFNGVLRLRWMGGGPTAVIKSLSGTIAADPATGFAKVALDGTASSDPEGKALRYDWKCLTADGGPTSIVIDTAPSPSVSLPVGTYKIQLTVSNGLVESAPVSTVITVASGAVNLPPTAVIDGPTGVVQADPATGLATIVLDGSRSSDPEGTSLRFDWRCLTPAGALAGIAIDSVISPSVRLPVGEYKIELRVHDGTSESVPDSIVVTVVAIPANAAPTAVVAGPTGPVRADRKTGLATIVLDGSKSSDPEGDSLRFDWRCLTAAGASTGVAIDSTPSPSVSLPAGEYRIELRVNDGTSDSAPDSMPVTVLAPAPNERPTAVVTGPTELVRPDPATGLASITLDATQSRDPEKDPLTFRWQCLTADGAPAGITVDSVCQPVLHLRGGQYRIELTVNDGMADSDPVAILVTVNTPPVAEAGEPQEVYDNGSGTYVVNLDGSRSSDPEAGNGQTLVYSWSCSTATLGTASGPAPSLTFPVGVHEVLLVVSDGLESSQDTTLVTVKPCLPAARVAASPSTIGRTGTVPDVKFYVLLPAGTSVADVDPQAPILLYANGATLQLTRDLNYSHKNYTVVAGTDRQRLLDLAGTMNGPLPAAIRVPLKTGAPVCATLTLEITAGPGPSPAVVQADRAFYYLDTRTWK